VKHAAFTGAIPSPHSNPARRLTSSGQADYALPGTGYGTVPDGRTARERRPPPAPAADALPVVLLAVIAGAGSFTHIRDIAAQHGQTGPMSWAVAQVRLVRRASSNAG
jgi:hypothetical protein